MRLEEFTTDNNEGVVYDGMYPHWRNSYPGGEYIQLFIHYTREDNPNADWCRWNSNVWGHVTDVPGEVAQNTENPFADYHHVLIPYCTGDIHWGNQTQTYGSGNSEVTIHHKGGVNAQAVLDWIAANYEEPEHLFVTGCSAGAYGSIMWAPHLVEMFPDATMSQFGDSGAGIVTEAWFAESFPSWNGEFAFPEHIPSLDPSVVDVSQKSTADLYAEVSNFYPDHVFSQFNTYWDSVQVRYFQFMGGGNAEEWNLNMLGNLERIQSSTANFSSYTAGGDRHCIITSDALYFRYETYLVALQRSMVVIQQVVHLSI